MKGKAHLKSKTFYFLICRLGKITGVLLFFFFFSTFLYSQTLVGRAQIHIQEEAEFYINGEKIENAEQLPPESSEKTKIYVSSGTLVSNFNSENIEIVEIKTEKPAQSVKSKKLAISKTVSKAETEIRVTEKQKTYSETNIKPVSSENTFLHNAHGNFSIALPVQNFQQKRIIAVIKNSYHREFLQKETFIENSFYENPGVYTYTNTTSFSVRPPPVV